MIFLIKRGLQKVSKIFVVTNITQLESIILNEIALTVADDLADELEETFVNSIDLT
jgi:hypothetical protein